ncbi:hypothetical protein [Neisseria iguanae]|uniref:Uncharacterized protein n=1 Tax=Neisseria iguanae TaxID=90242 RepID=A0A2P7U187_9NEIS|nr:hypothetical protein [Neisseria iguanae]PSJ80734.1 hypothetical protein C7N83_04375 [Neisseria iguanae]
MPYLKDNTETDTYTKPARPQPPAPRNRTNHRLKEALHGMKYSDKVGKAIEEKFIKQAGIGNISQTFARFARLQTDGKAERIILTLWKDGMIHFLLGIRGCSNKEPCRLMFFDHAVKPHTGLKSDASLRGCRLTFLHLPGQQRSCFLPLMTLPSRI